MIVCSTAYVNIFKMIFLASSIVNGAIDLEQIGHRKDIVDRFIYIHLRF